METKLQHLPSVSAFAHGADQRMAGVGASDSWASRRTIGDIMAVSSVAGTGVLVAGSFGGAASSGLQGAAVMTKGLSTFGPGGMLGGIGSLGAAGGLLGTAMVHFFVRNEQDKVYYSTVGASIVGMLIGSGVSLAAVNGAAASGLGGAAIATSGLAVLGSSMAGGIIACTGIGLGCALLLGLVAWSIWYFFGETGKTDDPTHDTFFDQLSKHVTISVPNDTSQHNSLNGTFLIHPTPASIDHGRLCLKNHMQNVLASLKKEDSSQKLDGLTVLRQVQAKLCEVQPTVPWYDFWSKNGEERVEKTIRLLATQFVMAASSLNPGALGTEDEAGNIQASLGVACEHLSEKGKLAFGVPYGRILCAGLDDLTQRVLDLTNGQERKDALKFFELPETATDRQIKMAYRQLSILMHPDRACGRAGAEELQKYVNCAYSLLLNRGRKAVEQVLRLTEAGEEAVTIEQQATVKESVEADIDAKTSPRDALAMIEATIAELHSSMVRMDLQKEAVREICRLRDVFNGASQVVTSESQLDTSASESDSEDASSSISSVTSNASTGIVAKGRLAQCFTPGTMFVDSEGVPVRVDHLRLCHQLLGPNGVAIVQKLEFHEVRKRHIVDLKVNLNPEGPEIVILSVTADHRIELQNGDYKEAASLSTGDGIKTTTGEYQLTSKSDHLKETAVFEVKFSDDVSVSAYMEIRPPLTLAACGAPHTAREIQFNFKGPLCDKGFQASQWCAKHLPEFSLTNENFSDGAPFSVWIPKVSADKFFEVAKEQIKANAPKGSRIRRQEPAPLVTSGFSSGWRYGDSPGPTP